MAALLHIKSDLLKLLAPIAFVPQGAAAYYRELRKSSDPYVAAGAWCALFDAKLVSPVGSDEVLAYCRHGAVRRRAYDFFQSTFDRSRAVQAANTAIEQTGDLDQAMMLADLSFDATAAAEAEGALYLATGELNHLGRASEHAETVGGWRAGLVWALRAVAIAPLNPFPILRLFVVLESSGQPELLEEIAEIFIARNMYLQIMQIFLANAALTRGDAELCLKRLKPLDDAKVQANAALSPYLGAIRALRAQAEEKLGHYKEAYAAYVALNAAEKSKTVDPEHYYKGIAIRSKLAIPDSFAPTAHAEVVQMVGFPRSGTTLLENIFNAHPQIETFEEIPAMVVAIDRIERVLLGKSPLEQPAETFIGARTRYYEEVEARRRKPDATLLIDKMPIRTAEADFIAKLFPEWRYVFSIRHPYDVVLSCFKQRFLPNPAMENFRSIESGIRLYDFAMTEWFKKHTIDDANVHYVRYEELVTNFERVAGDAIAFLGLPWDAAVLDFTKGAENRAAKTPSYQKVRQGLSIGVQTSWQNYGFAFQGKAVEPLRKWAEFFGYPTE